MITVLGDVPAAPAFAARLHVQPIPGEGVAFVGETGGAFLDGPAVAQVCALIDGRRSSAAIVDALAPRLGHEAVLQALQSLAQSQVIGESAGVPAGLAALWSEFGVDELRLRELLHATQVGLAPLTGGQAELTASLTRLGLALGSAPDRTLDVVLVDDYLDPRIADLNEQALAAGRPWLLVKASGVNIWVGPVFVPGQSACWECLRVRLRQNRPVERYLHRKHGVDEPLPVTREGTGVLAGHGYAMAAATVARWLARPADRAALASTVTVLEAISMQVGRHSVVRRPQCRACGDPARAVPATAAPRFSADTAAPAVVSRDGGEHTEAPEETFARYAHHVSPVTGLVSAVIPSPWNEQGPLCSFAAGHNHALANDTFRAVSDGLRSWSSGKGRSPAQARTSALCEALERMSGVWTGDEPTVRESCAALGDAAVDPRRCLQFSERQYEERDRWLTMGQFQVVPHRFRDDAVIDWSPLWSLTRGEVRYLPTSYLYFGYPHQPDAFFAWPDSNGNAAGATLADACLQGLYELVERDSVALWWYSRVPRPAADVDSLGDPWIGELREWYAARDREFWALDITADLGISAFVALSRRLSGPSSDIVMGFGAHHDPRLAVRRAVTEMNQFMPAVLDVGEGGITRYQVNDIASINWWRTATVDTHPYLRPLRSAPATSFADAPAPEGSSAYWFGRAADTLASRGHEVLVLDQTRPDVGLPVAKVVVPGLRHFWARFAPGRLYDVPVRLGWLDRPLTEDELNPTPMFL